jgi:hypothetical protein
MHTTHSSGVFLVAHRPAARKSDVSAAEKRFLFHLLLRTAAGPQLYLWAQGSRVLRPFHKIDMRVEARQTNDTQIK